MPVKEQMCLRAENSNRDVKQAKEVGVKDGIINTAWTGSGVPGKAWELRDSFLKEGKDCTWWSERWGKEEGLKLLASIGKLWTAYYKRSMGPKEWGKLETGRAGLGSCAMLKRSSDLILRSTGVYWRIWSRRLATCNVHLLVLLSSSWLALFWDFLMPRRSHWGYCSQRLQGTFHSIIWQRRTKSESRSRATREATWLTALSWFPLCASHLF